MKKLPVSAAFHSRYMRDAEREFAARLREFEFAAPRIRVLSNVTAEPHTPETMRDLLARQIASPVRWTESVRWLLRQPSPQFFELGPGNVLTGLLRRVQTEGAPASS